MEKYQKYAEYKDSGVEWLGMIPSSWQVKKLKYLCQVTTGNKDTVNAVEDGKYPFFVRSQTVERINSIGADCEAVLTAGDGVGVGKVYHYYKGKFDFHQRVYMLYDFGAVTGRFVYYYLSSNFYKVALEGNAKSTVDSLRLPQFLNFEFSLPTIEEQNQIANFLDHETAQIDILIAKQEKLIELLKEKRQAVISHAVTKGLNPTVAMKDSGVEWIGEVPKHWKVSKLKYESEVVDCRNKTPEYFDDGEYFVVRTTNVKNQELNFNGALYTDKKNFDIWTQRGVPPVGSILFTREAPTGQVCLVPDNLKFCMGQRMMNFISYDSHYGDYLFDYLISDCLDRYINSVSHGSTVTHLRVEQVENIPVLVPGKEEIKEIHLHILKIKQQFNALEQKALETIRLMQERRTALISSAVTGKIDVRNWQYPNEATTELSQ